MKEMKLDIAMAKDIPWELTQGATPATTIHVKYQPYEALRQRFWRQYLARYDTDDTSAISQLELEIYLNSLGSTLTKSTIESFFTRYGKNPEEDELLLDKPIQCLETELRRPLSEKKRVDVNEESRSSGVSASITLILTVTDKLGEDLDPGGVLFANFYRFIPEWKLRNRSLQSTSFRTTNIEVRLSCQPDAFFTQPQPQPPSVAGTQLNWVPPVINGWVVPCALPFQLHLLSRTQGCVHYTLALHCLAFASPSALSHTLSQPQPMFSLPPSSDVSRSHPIICSCHLALGLASPATLSHGLTASLLCRICVPIKPPTHPNTCSCLALALASPATLSRTLSHSLTASPLRHCLAFASPSTISRSRPRLRPVATGSLPVVVMSRISPTATGTDHQPVQP